MKKILSILLSISMLLSCSVAFAAADNVTSVIDEAKLAKYLTDGSEYFAVSFNDSENVLASAGVMLETSTDSESEIEGHLLVDLENEIFPPYNETMTETTNVKISSSASQKNYLGITKQNLTNTKVIFVLNSKLTKDTNVTLKIFNTDKNKCISYTHTFVAPVSFENASLKGFGDVLTALKKGDNVSGEDVAAAIAAVADDSTNFTAAINELKSSSAVTDEVIANLAAILADSKNITSVKADGVELPWAALSAKAEAGDVFAPIVTAGTTANTDSTKDSFALDIKIGKNNNAVSTTPIFKQKVIVDLPSNWDLSKGVTYSHNNGTAENATVENGKAIIYTDSFSNFEFIGTLAKADNDEKITKNVTVVVEQNDNVFTISLKPETGKQIINYASATFNINLNQYLDNGYTPVSMVMETASYELIAADGITITNQTDNALGTKELANITFNALAKNNELITKGEGESLKIAEIKINGKGDFKMIVSDASVDKTGIIMKSANEIDDKYAAVTQKVGHYNIAEKLYKLNFDIMFKLGIVKTEADYLGMNIAVKNSLTGEVKNVMVGTGSDADVTYLPLTQVGDANADGYATAEGYIELAENTLYDYEITGAGFRTFRGSVYLDQDKTINLWNTAYDTAQAVISNDDTTKKTATFLVGDIYMDNKVDVYDLSAVVAYFNQDPTNVGVSYDLDRDGDIDVRDISFVQMNYGK